MNRRIILGVLLALVLMAGVASLGIYAYNLGVAQGISQSIQLSDLPPGAEMSPYLYYRSPFFFPPFGFRFFGCFGPLLFFFLFFVLFRGFWWGGRWGHGPGWKRRHWEGHVPPMFEEWHRQAHRQESEPTPPSAEG
ncbi:MAG: hypothetical protein H6632_06335 [Anaerolineales bacterium]|nr:hypothetical protein [Anaerolineales bacterium]